MRPTPIPSRAWPARLAAACAAALVLGALASAAGAAETAAKVPPGIERPRLADADVWAVGLPQLILLVVLGAVVFYLADWAFLDTRFVGTNRTLWSGLVLGGAVAGLLAALFLPVFYVGFPVGVLLAGGVAVIYTKHRNGLVTENLTVLSGPHLRRLKDRLAGRRSVADTSGPVTGVGRDIIFMSLDDLPIRMEAAKPVEAEANQETERILFDAIVRRAAVVGVLIKGRRAQVRYRIDGQVAEAPNVEGPVSPHVAATLKRLAGLDPSETRKPQQGKVRAVVAGQTFELRIKTSGSVRGEQLAIRVLDLATTEMRLEDLGLAESQIETLKTALDVKPGLVVVSGPKDSGLTTTLLACLRHYDRYMNTVVSFEPHVDLEVQNVQHVPLTEDTGAGAAAKVQEHVRMQPDVVAVDSLASPEVGQVLAPVVAEARLVVGLRASDAAQAMARMAQLFGSTHPLSEGLHLVANQRLVRMLCPECKEAYRPNPDFLRKANLASQKVDVLYRPPSHPETDRKGRPVVCARCQNVRYTGRTGLFELMPIDEEARAMIASGASAADVRTHARKLGMRNLQEEGLRLVIDGTTSIEEVLRAIKQAK